MAMSQKRLEGVVSLDMKPRTYRSGGPGDKRIYIIIIKNLSKETKTWPIDTSVEPQEPYTEAPGILVHQPGPGLSLFAQKAIRYEIVIEVKATAIPGQEVKIRFEIPSVLFVERYFTVFGGTKHPR